MQAELLAREIGNAAAQHIPSPRAEATDAADGEGAGAAAVIVNAEAAPQIVGVDSKTTDVTPYAEQIESLQTFLAHVRA